MRASGSNAGFPQKISRLTKSLHFLSKSKISILPIIKDKDYEDPRHHPED
jgi:hypothetical protein